MTGTTAGLAAHAAALREPEAPPEPEPSSAPSRWVLAVMAMFSILAFWAHHYYTTGFYHSSFSDIRPMAVLAGLIIIWMLAACRNFHRRPLAGAASLLPIMVLVAIAMTPDGAGTAAERQEIWALIGSSLAMLAITAASWRRGGRQTARQTLKEELVRAGWREADRKARWEKERPERERLEAEHREEEARRAEAARREEIIETATLNLAKRFAGSADQPAGPEIDAEAAAGLALCHDSGRRKAEAEAEKQRLRADAAEAELDEANRRVRELEQYLVDLEKAERRAANGRMTAEAVNQLIRGVTTAALIGAGTIHRR